MGDRIADLYDVREVHEQGAMGLVYRVRHLGWDVDLAVKSPRPDLFATEPDKQRFIREAETWVSLGLHPHVCACHYVRTLAGAPRVFAEYVDGGSLRDWIDDGRLYEGGPEHALARVLDLAIQTAWGLAHAHDHAVVHQDVKPANVLLARDGTAKVTDFGLARASELGSARASNESGGGTILVTVGGLTRAYASPEQAAGSRVGRRSDVWSFAVSVLEMFTGGVTWAAGPVAGAALAAYRQQGTAADLRVPMPASVADVLAACLRDDPADRPANLEEVVARLAEAYQLETGSAYGRPRPSVIELRADELNNRALSLLDLGRVGEAEGVFDEALTVDPQHLEATFNAGLLRWRSGQLRDDELVTRLEAVRAGTGNRWQALHLLARVHLERGDPEAARPLLEQATAQAPDDPQLRADLERARTDAHAISRTLCTLTLPSGEPVLPTHLSADRSVALSVKREGGRSRADSRDVVRVWDARTGRHLRDLQHRMGERIMDRAGSVPVGEVCLSPDGRQLIAGSDFGGLHVWNTTTGECRDLDQHGRVDRSMSLMSDRIVSVCLGDSGRFAFSRNQHTVQLWDLRTGRCLDTSEGTYLVGNGRVAVTASRDKVLVWDLDTGGLLHRLIGHALPVRAVSLNPDGRFAVSGEHDYRIEPTEHLTKVWDLSTGECVGTLRGNSTPVTAVAVDVEARWALTGTRNGEVHLWEVATGRRLRTLKGHERPATSIRLSSDGQLAVTGEYSPRVLGHLAVRVWELTTGRCRYTIEEDLCVRSDGSAVFTGHVQGEIREWRAPLERYSCPLHPCRPTAHAELTRAHSRVESLVQEAERAMADQQLTTAKELLEEARQTPGMERSPAVLASWRRLGQWSRYTGVRATWPATMLHGIRPGNGLCVSADGRTVLVACEEDPTIHLWDVQTGRCLQALTGHSTPVRSLAMRADARIAVSGSGGDTIEYRDGRRITHDKNDNLVRVWDVDTTRCLRVLHGHSSSVAFVDVTPDGRVALSAQRPKPDLLDALGRARGLTFINVWDLTAGRCLQVFEPHPEWSCVTLTPDGRFAVSADEGDDVLKPTLRVWDIATGRCLHAMDGHTSTARCIDVSSDACVAVSGGPADPVMRVWDLATGHCLRTLDVRLEHGTGPTQVRSPEGVDSLALNADGRLLLSAGRMDETVRLWDVTTGRCLHAIGVPGAAIQALGWSGDGRFVFVRTEDGVRVWEVDWELAVRDPVDWDEGARSYLNVFLTQQMPFATSRSVINRQVRRGQPSWDEDDFQRLLRELRHAGYGWLRPEGVRAELARMVRD